MTHNEALTLLDLAVGARVLAVADDPPPAPAIGECWIVGAAPTGDWAGHAAAIAGWTPGGWRFVAPVEGLAAWVAGAGVGACFTSGAWRIGEVAATRIVIGGVQVLGAQAAAIPDPDGGTTVDAECRGALEAVLAALRTHGIVAA